MLNSPPPSQMAYRLRHSILLRSPSSPTSTGRTLYSCYPGRSKAYRHRGSCNTYTFRAHILFVHMTSRNTKGRTQGSASFSFWSYRQYMRWIVVSNLIALSQALWRCFGRMRERRLRGDERISTWICFFFQSKIVRQNVGIRYGWPYLYQVGVWQEWEHCRPCLHDVILTPQCLPVTYLWIADECKPIMFPYEQVIAEWFGLRTAHGTTKQNR